MKKAPFIGRTNELKNLENLTNKSTSSLVVIYGRRRIGKSRLIEEFAKNSRFLRFSGLPPTPKTTAQDQKNEFSRQFSKELQFPNIQVTDWGDLFSLLARETKIGKFVILLDEISWMGSKDPLFLGKLKNAWDIELKNNPNLILILCGSVSSWIEKNILRSTGFMGRISLQIPLKELHLSECNQFFDAIGFHGSSYDRFKILSVTGGVPRYLEEINPYLPFEANMEQLCFSPHGVLFREFEDIFSDLFSKKSSTYKKIVSTLINGSKEISEIAKETNLSGGGHLSACLEDLIQLGFIRRNYSWKIESQNETKLSRFTLSDNYLRFYLKYIEPHYEKIVNRPPAQKFFKEASPSDSVMGLQFENLIIANRSLIWDQLTLNPAEITNDNPFFQRKTSRTKGCQIDYFIQYRNNLYVCEIKFSKNSIGPEVIEQVKQKINSLSKPKNFSCWPVLIHVNGVKDSVIESKYFAQIIDFSSLLQQGQLLATV